MRLKYNESFCDNLDILTKQQKRYERRNFSVAVSEIWCVYCRLKSEEFYIARLIIELMKKVSYFVEQFSP